MEWFANFILPAVICIIVIYGLYKNIDVFSTFTAGAKQGIQTSMNIPVSYTHLDVYKRQD